MWPRTGFHAGVFLAMLDALGLATGGSVALKMAIEHPQRLGLVLDPASLSDELIAIRLDICRQPAMADAMPRLLAFSLGGQALTHAQWQSLQLPIQVIAAIDAPNMFLKNAYAIAELAPLARLVELPGCDHWAQYEQPERFNAVSIEFLLQS
ncbi:MAG: hypothetical protein U1F00_23125 [Rhodoferax sp.]